MPIHRRTYITLLGFLLLGGILILLNLAKPAWWSALTGTTYGPVRMEVTFPKDSTVAFMPLLAIGEEGAGDIVYAERLSPDSVRFRLISSGRIGPLSAPFTVVPGIPYQIEISAGPLYPPHEDANWNGIPLENADALRRLLRIKVDGKEAMNAPTSFAAAGPRHLAFGRAPFLENFVAKRFPGEIGPTSRLPITDEEITIAAPSYGPIRLAVTFPQNAYLIPQAEPLVVTGETGAGDFIFVSYVGTGRLVIGHDHWGVPVATTRPLPIDYSVKHEIVISLGSLYPPREDPFWALMKDEEINRLKDRVTVTIDGAIVLDLERPTFESSPSNITVGLNAIGGSLCAYKFSGDFEKLTQK